MSFKRDSGRESALKQVKDILSTSPQLSTSPRRKSAPDAFSRKPSLKVDLPSATDDFPVMLRKKSGEIVRSSLKKGKSEPTTPTFPKYVHFNTDLEQIKLFDESQKPQAVSADISEAESDDDELDLISDTDGEEESILGRVQVQNIAFEKVVNIRYTFDSWQSVSEVSTSYAGKVPNRSSANNFDIFIFTIELIDNSRNSIDGKTLYFAVHYQVNGCDYWDNNDAQNYQSSRYDISSSLHAAQSASRPTSSSANLSNSYYSPAISYGNDSFGSFFPGNYIDGMPGTLESSNSVASSWDDSKAINFQSLKPSTPIAIPTKPAIGSTPYYDLVNQYCFYQGSPYGAASPYASSPPVMT
ncbi:16352_t:CDS:2 [Acaulospora colombiana]|uniref:16352_t:CDS:1 n=1 Tax=Acaulospora colombiana TaxID=27376 RepID=A0ACA9LF44_9GLOM|nr:16352_t:CDS:2 [Acaulospora colombiana]